MLTATFDIGTTAVKAAVVREDKSVAYTDSAGLSTIENGGFHEQDPREWEGAFLEISRRILKELPREEIKAVIFSGQMQDVIPVDEEGNALGNAILYSDGRAAAQAEKILKRAGEAYISRITGNHFDGSMPLAKILWIKENEPERYKKTEKFLISPKDYLIGRLTGRYVSDVTACSTAGAMELSKKSWSPRLLELAGIAPSRLPEIHYVHTRAGFISPHAAQCFGYSEKTGVYVGTGDAGATTLASGILSAGEYNINLGTSSWVAAVSDGWMESAGGGFNLAAMQPEKYINVVPFFNGGNVHRFLAEVFSREKGEADYAYISALLKESMPGSHGVFCLPYLCGERFPVMDERVRGGYLGFGQETTAADLARSALEGVAYSIRQGLERLGRTPKKLTLIGGGAREEAWCRILCGVMGKEIHVYREPALLPALATAAAVFLEDGRIRDYGEFIDALSVQGHCTVYKPGAGEKELYDRLYEDYKRIYPVLKEFYGQKERQE